jgi:hypothetical protein
VYFEALEDTNKGPAPVAIISSEDTKAFDLWYKTFFKINFPGTLFLTNYYSSLAEATKQSDVSSILELKGGMLSNLGKDFEREGYIFNGSYWSDNWVGKNFSITASKQVCPVIEVDFLGSVFTNTVQISSSRGYQRTFDELSNPKTILLKVENAYEVFDFDFKQVFIPKELGISPDIRSLSTRMSFSCQK